MTCNTDTSPSRGDSATYLVMQVKTAQRMKTMSTKARQMINLWKVSLNSFLQRIRILVTFPSVRL